MTSAPLCGDPNTKTILVSTDLCFGIMHLKINLTALDKESLEKEMIKIGEKPFRAKQIWNWIYARGAMYVKSWKKIM